MNLVSGLFKLTYFKACIIILIVTIAQCKEKSFYSCDLYSNNQCLITESSVYLVPKPKQPVSSFTDLSHYLYFHSKITPGLRVNQITDSKECWYRLSDPTGKLQPVEGRLEGFRVDDSGTWCFDYFGTFLLQFVRLNKIDNQPASLDLFPLKLEIGLITDQKPAPQIQRLIRLQLEGWQFQ